MLKNWSFVDRIKKNICYVEFNEKPVQRMHMAFLNALGILKLWKNDGASYSLMPGYSVKLSVKLAIF